MQFELDGVLLGVEDTRRAFPGVPEVEHWPSVANGTHVGRGRARLEQLITNSEGDCGNREEATDAPDITKLKAWWESTGRRFFIRASLPGRAFIVQ